MKKTIGYYDDSVGPGGTTRYLMNLISGIDRDEFDLVFFAPRRRPWHRDLDAAGVEVVTLLPDSEAAAAPAAETPSSPEPQRRRRIPAVMSWWLGLAKEIVRLKKLFAKRKVDLLHSNNAGAEPAPVAARLAGVPVVMATWHVDSTYDLEGVRNGLRYRLLEKACMRSLHRAISVSHATAADWIGRCGLSGNYQRRVTVIHNGIDVDGLRRRRSVEDAQRTAGVASDLVIGSIGRLEKAKGYEYLIRALPAVLVRFPDALLRIAGRGDLQQSLTELAHSLNVDKHVEFAGFQTDVLSFLETLDIYVQPSLCEALGLGAMEACAAGVPVIASRVGGLVEIIIPGETGITVPPRDAEALARAIVALAGDSVLKTKIQTNAPAFAQRKFRREDMVGSTVAVYRELLPRSSTSIPSER